MTDIVIASFYQFAWLPDYEILQQRLLAFCRHLEVKGTILLAREGINGTIAGSRTAVESVMDYLRTDPSLVELEYRGSSLDHVPFRRMKVRLRDEIVTFGHPAVDPTSCVGQYVEPAKWNALISDPDTLLIDSRNSYEVKIGTFARAINPDITSFREFRDFVGDTLEPSRHRKIALFCTGGIRCEKATSHMVALGFQEVYHLQGGILRYLAEVPPEESLWRGECFVFDERVSVKHDLTPGDYDMCHACKRPITEEDKKGNAYVPGVSCPHCIDEMTADQKRRFAERQKQINLARKRGEAHMGPDAAANRRREEA